jgi:NAD+ diphosphatase
MKFCPKCGSELIMREIDGRTRLGCSSPSCAYVFWDNPIPVVAAIVELDGKVVLVRNKTWPQKMFGLVTGFLEKGETPEAGVLREVKEELSLEGEVVRFVGYYSFFEMNQLILAYHVRAQGEIALGEELADMRLILPENLRPWPMGTGIAVRDWLGMRKAPQTP